ncbi:hypothetical protein Cgig2_002982 [Carnegiea gigantea]|uniref:Uncharacterized protein n=1 Tax=Carnegiea gigantea TaxID=171969 RepID=A0A9Q1K6W9_9CARY|nr:hypothetical protein Cgig2_002982 [Carnegiea gigantea]
MNTLLTASQMNREAKMLCDKYFSKLKELVDVECGSVYGEDNVQQDGLSSVKSKFAEVIPENVIGSQELFKPTNLEGQRSTKAAAQNADVVLNGAPLCMNAHYAGPSSKGNVSTIAAVGYCPPFYFDPRTIGALAPMMFQSFIGQTPIKGAYN